MFEARERDDVTVIVGQEELTREELVQIARSIHESVDPQSRAVMQRAALLEDREQKVGADDRLQRDAAFDEGA